MSSIESQQFAVPTLLQPRILHLDPGSQECKIILVVLRTPVIRTYIVLCFTPCCLDPNVLCVMLEDHYAQTVILK